MNAAKTLALALALAPLLALAAPKNLIVMVPDGTGMATLTVARQVKGAPLALARVLYGAADCFVFDGAVVGDYRGFGFEAYLCGGSVDFVYRLGDAADAVVAVHAGDFYRFSAEDGAVEPLFGGGLRQAGAAASAA